MTNRILAVPKISGYERVVERAGTETEARSTFDSEHDWARILEDHHHEKEQLALFKSRFPVADIVNREQLPALVPQYDIFVFLGGDDHYKHSSHYILRYLQQRPGEKKFVLGVNLNPLKSAGALLGYTVESFLEAQERIRKGDFKVSEEMVLEAIVANESMQHVFPACSEYRVTEYCDANSRRVKVLEPERLQRMSRPSSGMLVATPFGRKKGSWFYNATHGQAELPSDVAGVALSEVGEVMYDTLRKGETLKMISKNDSRGVIFIDGHEEHYTSFPMGSRAEIKISDLTLPVING